MRFGTIIAFMLLVAALFIYGCPAKQPGGTAAGGDTGSTAGTPSDAASDSAAGAGSDQSTPPVAADGSVASGETSTNPTGGETTTPPVAASAVEVGKPTPDVALTTLDGKAMRIADFKGKGLVINFWATWCEPCKAEFPDFKQVYDASAGKFAMVSFADPTSADPAEYVKKSGWNWTFAWDKGGEAMTAYAARILPVTVFVDKNGVVVAKHRGKMEKSEFEAEIAKII